ncbi:hypothetical protein NC652_040722 [Populus alba x Populus x berolinensis]|nr:hypothetical protein NC652_040722 [Populus alba x Populus x berolinensis]
MKKGEDLDRRAGELNGVHGGLELCQIGDAVPCLLRRRWRWRWRWRRQRCGNLKGGARKSWRKSPVDECAKQLINCPFFARNQAPSL